MRRQVEAVVEEEEQRAKAELRVVEGGVGVAEVLHASEHVRQRHPYVSHVDALVSNEQLLDASLQIGEVPRHEVFVSPVGRNGFEQPGSKLWSFFG